MQTSVGESGRKWEIPGKLIPARSVQKGAYVLWTRHFLFRCHNLSLFVIQRCNEPTSCTDSQLFKWNCDTSCRRCCTKCKLGVEKVVSLNANFEFKFIMNRENWKLMKEWNGNGGQRGGGWLWWEHYCKHPLRSARMSATDVATLRPEQHNCGVPHRAPCVLHFLSRSFVRGGAAHAVSRVSAVPCAVVVASPRSLYHYSRHNAQSFK